MNTQHHAQVASVRSCIHSDSIFNGGSVTNDAIYLPSVDMEMLADVSILYVAM